MERARCLLTALVAVLLLLPPRVFGVGLLVFAVGVPAVVGSPNNAAQANAASRRFTDWFYTHFSCVTHRLHIRTPCSSFAGRWVPRLAGSETNNMDLKNP